MQIIPIRNETISLETNEKINTDVVIICKYVQRSKAGLISVRCVNLRGTVNLNQIAEGSKC